MPLHPALNLRAVCAALLLTATPAAADGVAGDFDFYVLSLSWSPTYCAGDDPDPRQCNLSDLGFTVHGLWPQYERGYPEYCPSSMPRWLSDETVDMIRDVMPSAGFARYQWRKHGMCSGLGEDDYFSLLVEAAGSVTIPATLADGDVSLSPKAIENAFVAANPGLSQGGMSVQCERGLFEEVRICLTRDLAFRDCPEVDEDTCRAGTIDLPPAD